MKAKLLTILLLLLTFILNAQQLQLLDRFNDNKLVNDSTVTVFSSDVNINEITQYFTMKNTTDKPLSVFLRKTVNFYADSTTDYYCFGVRCWPGDDSTTIADTIPAGGEDYTFASHVVHKRRFDIPQPPLPPGLSSITYTIYDKTTFPTPVEASVTVFYHQSGLGVEEAGEQGSREAGKVALVYPNPASDWLIIETGECKPGKYTLLLSNNLGNQVHRSAVLLQDGQLTIPVIGLVPGFYYGRLISEQATGVDFRFQVAR
jgi:hypothetical protein